MTDSAKDRDRDRSRRIRRELNPNENPKSNQLNEASPKKRLFKNNHKNLQIQWK